MISDIPNDKIFLHSEMNNNNSTFHNNELTNVDDDTISNELKMTIFYLKSKYLIPHIRLYVNIYITILRTRVKYQIMLLVCYLK